MKNTVSVIMQLAAGKEEGREKELYAYLEELNRSMDIIRLTSAGARINSSSVLCMQ